MRTHIPGKVLTVIIIVVISVSSISCSSEKSKLRQNGENGAESSSRKNPYLKAIRIDRQNPEYPIIGRRFEDLTTGNIEIELDFEIGESIEGQVITLETYADDKREYMVEQRFETSVIASDEGPYIALVDWKHYYSDWISLKSIEKNRYLISTIDASESIKFPEVTKEELQKAVLDAGEGLDPESKEWARGLAMKCANPHEHPCDVSPSKISLKVNVKENGGWETINQVDISPLMGD